MTICYLPGNALAKVKGLCSNCHTMHFSQTPWPTEWGSSGPNPALLVNDCVGCHSSSSSSTYYDLGGCEVPAVLYTGAGAPSTYLAGGNFWWVKEGLGGEDTKGHNVFLGEDDEDLSGGAPGDWVSCAQSCHVSLTHQTAIPELGSGCQGCHLNVRHHANDHANLESGLVDSADKGWYRFLSGHMSGSGHGVEGYEDGDWEATVSVSDHNEYLGWEGVLGSQAGFYNLGHTMTAFCCGCHGNFHIQEGGGWIRHPSDAVIPNSGEYANAFGANGTGTGTYDPLVPVARTSLPSLDPSKVDIGTDLVQCLSCHRPHGSPYFKLMRWDYKNWPGGTNGCNVCHTEKD